MSDALSDEWIKEILTLVIANAGDDIDFARAVLAAATPAIEAPLRARIDAQDQEIAEWYAYALSAHAPFFGRRPEKP